MMRPVERSRDRSRDTEPAGGSLAQTRAGTPGGGLQTLGAMSFARVAFALPLRQTFTYRIPDELAGRVRPGVEVQAPFRGRPRRGFVVGLTERGEIEAPAERTDRGGRSRSRPAPLVRDIM